MSCQLSVHADDLSHTLRPHTKFKGKGVDTNKLMTHMFTAIHIRTHGLCDVSVMITQW